VQHDVFLSKNELADITLPDGKQRPAKGGKTNAIDAMV